MQRLFGESLDHVSSVRVEVLVLLLHQVLMILVFYLLVLVFGNQCTRREHTNLVDNSSLLFKEAIGYLLGSLVLDVVDLLVEHLSQVRVQTDSIHHLLVQCFVVKFAAQGVRVK
jgi:hypothetical protein